MAMSFNSLLLTFLLAVSVGNVFAQSIPKFGAEVGVKEGGTIAKGEFLAQQGVRGLRHISNSHWESIPIDSFNIVALRDTVMIFCKKINGQLFTDDLRSELKSLKSKDKIIIYDIFGKDYGEKVVSIRPLEFRLE
jgi:hypothetical protein